jgi:hypothetical protein
MDLIRVDVQVGDKFKHIAEGSEWVVTEVDGDTIILYAEAKTSDEHRYIARREKAIRLSVEYDRI